MKYQMDILEQYLLEADLHLMKVYVQQTVWECATRDIVENIKLHYIMILLVQKLFSQETK